MTEQRASEHRPGRREEHKRRTGRALQQAALELFARRGYDATTTDEIADQAGVSPRTFFRYFPTKESVLFVGEYGWVGSFVETFRAVPASLTDVDAIRDTLLTLTSQLTRTRRALVLYQRAVESSPTLRGRVTEHEHEEIRVVAEALAERQGLRKADDRASLLATVCLVTYRLAITQWITGPSSAEPSTVVAEHFELLRDLFTTSASNGRARATRPATRQTARAKST